MAGSPIDQGGVRSPASTASDFDHISSTHSLSSSESFEKLASDLSADEDEIVWSVSSQASLTSPPPGDRVPSALHDGGDFVLVKPSNSPTGPLHATENAIDDVASSLARLSLPAASPSTPKELWSDQLDDRREPPHSATMTESGKPATAPARKPAACAASPSPVRVTGRRSKRPCAAGGAEGDVGVWSYPSPAPTPTTERPSAATTPTPYAKERRPALPPQALKKRATALGSKAQTKSAVAKQTPAVKAKASAGFGERPVVDDMSEMGDAADRERAGLLCAAYDEAVKFMNSFILDPTYYTSKASRLTFLQALIIELGLCDDDAALPSTLRAAKTMLRSQAFLNVRDYLAVRSQGLDALRAVMHPSRRSLVNELRSSKKSIKGGGGERGRRAAVGWVKETGLTVLLVACYR